MPGNLALDMSLDDLIKKSRSKPAGKKPAGQGAAAKPGQQQKAGGTKGKPGQKQQQQQQQKQKQPAQKQQQALKAKGGVQKPGAGGARTPVKAQQRPGQQKRPDVRVVPRPGAGRGGPAMGARPPLRPVSRPPPVRPLPRPAPRYMGPPGGYMGPGPQMMMQQAPMMMQQQPMMMQRQMMPAAQQQPQQVAPTELFDGSVVSSKTSSKLLVSNLDYKVTDEDIKELFGTVGSIKESYIHYDKNGRSLGAATVVFVAREDALTAFNRYNNVALDNKRMAIEVVEQAVPRGTFKTLSSGINVSRPQGGAAGYRGRGAPQGDMMVE